MAGLPLAGHALTVRQHRMRVTSNGLLIALTMSAVICSGDALAQVSVERDVVFAEQVLRRVPRLQAWPDLATVPRLATVNGVVVLRFVIDTVGKIEAESVEVVAVQDSALLPPIAAFLAGSRYRPAELPSGLRVPALLERTFIVAESAIMLVGPRDTTVIR